jgi:hypothetical protein
LDKPPFEEVGLFQAVRESHFMNWYQSYQVITVKSYAKKVLLYAITYWGRIDPRGRLGRFAPGHVSTQLLRFQSFTDVRHQKAVAWCGGAGIVVDNLTFAVNQVFVEIPLGRVARSFGQVSKEGVCIGPLTMDFSNIGNFTP